MACAEMRTVLKVCDHAANITSIGEERPDWVKLKSPISNLLDSPNPGAPLLARLKALEAKVKAGDAMARTLEKSDWCRVMSCALAAYRATPPEGKSE